MRYIVELENIVKHFGNVEALNGVTLRIEQGEHVAIIGSSGSGKSTLMRCINHLEHITSGRIVINGAPIAETVDGHVKYKSEAEIRASIMETAMVFQHFNLFGHLTVLENITIAPIQIKKEDPAEVKARAMELLKTVGLEHKAQVFPSQLSGGQKQRVAIARALAMRPSVLLFDEPTSALDPEVTGDVLRVIRDLATQGYTMLLVTHEMAFAREVSTRIIYMDKGNIVEEGSPKDIFENPQSKRLQDFLSSIL